MDPIPALAASAALFLATHFVPSHPPVRDRLVARLGTAGFLGAYSAVSLVTWAPLVALFFTHPHAGALLWVRRDALSVHAAELVCAVGLGLVGAGMAQPAPTSLTARPSATPEPRGATQVTRHPMMVGIALVSLTHAALNGWVGDLLFFGSHAALALLGAAHQDHRHTAQRPGYAAFRARTSFLPDPRGFARMGGRAWAGFAIGVVVALALRSAHRWL